MAKQNAAVAIFNDHAGAEHAVKELQRAGFDIKKAEGIKQAKIHAAEGEAETIRLANEAANTYFVGSALLLRDFEVQENSLSHNAKIVIPSGSELVNVIGEMAGVLPLRKQTPAMVPDQSL